MSRTKRFGRYARFGVVAMTGLLWAGIVSASCGLNPADYETILFPLYISTPLHGAYGSIWSTESYVHNGSDATIAVANGVPVCQIYCPNIIGLAPDEVSTTDHAIPDERSPGNPGLLLYIDQAQANDASFFLRVRDESRQSATWGTAVPVVRHSAMRHGRVVLLNVPTDARFRTALRIYSTVWGEHTVHVRFYSLYDTTPLAEVVLQLGVGTAIDGSCGTLFPREPTIAQLLDVANDVPGIATVDKLRIEVAPDDDELPFWAFASVTNDETQHVTLIMPQ